MSEANQRRTPETPLEFLLTILREARAASMRLRKASLQKEFMTARHMLQDAYADYEPSDLPVDLQKVLRDCAITRDRAIDESCDEVEKSFRITVGVLKTVAERYPHVYEDVAKKTGIDPRQWKSKPLPRVMAPRIGRALPGLVVLHLSASSMGSIVDEIMKAEDGIGFHRLCEKLGLDATPQSRLATKRFLAFLRKGGHVRPKGSGKGLRYSAHKTLMKLRETLLTRTEAAAED